MRGAGGWLTAAAIGGFLGVAIGAYAAHGAGAADLRAARFLETAGRYAQIHALALLAVTLLGLRPDGPGRLLRVTAWAFVLGTVLFSGALTVTALGGPAWLGPLVPLGGTLFLVGWGCLALAGWRWARV